MSDRPQPQLPDSRNAKIMVWVDGQLVPRDQAKVSVFDSSVQAGDAVWEGLRVYDGGVFALDAHLERLERSARALAFAQIPSRSVITDALAQTLRANGMRDGAHVRLTLTRGAKVTSGMSPHWNQSGPTLIVLAEWKEPVYGTVGIKLITSSVRRNPPQCLDSKIHHANLLNNILAKIEANAAGADDALMLDIEGYVAETNATNVFIAQGGQLLTPWADHCLPGITRATVLRIAREASIPCAERRLSLSEVHMADEVFTTGTMGELAAVLAVDGRTIGNGEIGRLTRRLQVLYGDWVRRERLRLPIG